MARSFARHATSDSLLQDALPHPQGAHPPFGAKFDNASSHRHHPGLAAGLPRWIAPLARSCSVEKAPTARRSPKFLSISFVRQIRLPRKAGEANLPPELLATHLVVRPGKTCERLPCANLAYNPHCAHILLIFRSYFTHILLTLPRSNFPRVRLCIPDRWSGLGLRRAFGAFSALKRAYFDSARVCAEGAALATAWRRYQDV